MQEMISDKYLRELSIKLRNSIMNEIISFRKENNINHDDLVSVILNALAQSVSVISFEFIISSHSEAETFLETFKKNIEYFLIKLINSNLN